MKIVCPQCKSDDFWFLSDGRSKCKICYKKFSRPKTLDKKLLRQIVLEFLLEHSTNVILNRINISKRKLLEILTLLRIEMTKDVSAVFEGIVEVDETYIGGK